MSGVLSMFVRLATLLSPWAGSACLVIDILTSVLDASALAAPQL